jgi:hypothetical protein
MILPASIGLPVRSFPVPETLSITVSSEGCLDMLSRITSSHLHTIDITNEYLLERGVARSILDAAVNLKAPRLESFRFSDVAPYNLSDAVSIEDLLQLVKYRQLECLVFNKIVVKGVKDSHLDTHGPT